MEPRSNLALARLEDLMDGYRGKVPGAGVLVLNEGAAVIRQTLGEPASPKKSVVYDLDLCDDVLPSLSS